MEHRSPRTAAGGLSQRQGMGILFGVYLSFGLSPLYWNLLHGVSALEMVSHRSLWGSLIIAAFMVWKGQFPAFFRAIRDRREIALRSYEPVLMHLPSYLDMKVEPSVLQKGERGLITLTLNTEKLTDLGLTQASVYLSRFTGDKVSDENEIPLSAILLPDFSGMTDTDRANAPVIRLSETDIDLSALLAKKNKVKHDIQLTNTGRSPLQISKLQVFNPALGVSLKKSVLQPGETTRLRVTVDKKNIAKKKRHLRILMITNDPMQPKVEINIKAK